MDTLVFVDTQYDFINPNGRLYIKDAEKILKNVLALTTLSGMNQISTSDWHEVDDPEFSEYPPHCIKYSTGSHNYTIDTAMVFLKQTYDVWDKKRGASAIYNVDFSGNVYVCGVATDICVKAFVEGLLIHKQKDPFKIFLIVDAMKGLEKELETIQNFVKMGIQTITTEEILMKYTL